MQLFNIFVIVNVNIKIHVRAFENASIYFQELHFRRKNNCICSNATKSIDSRAYLVGGEVNK